MEDSDVKVAEVIVQKALDSTADRSDRGTRYRLMVAAVVEGIRVERDRLARWIVTDTHSVISRGTAVQLYESIVKMAR